MNKKEGLGHKKYLYYIAELIAFILLICFYNNHTALLPQSSELYSTALPYRLQTNAFLQGKLTLSPHPFGIPWDFDYTELGMQQNWGLGVPLLRLPFEALARACGFAGFPDRLVLFFYIALMIVMMGLAFRLLLISVGLKAPSGPEFFSRWGFIAWFLFSPFMSGLIQYKFRIYEEAVFYECIYSAILLAIFWMYMLKLNERVFMALCLVSGLAWIMRPTLIFYGAITFGLAIVYAYQNTKNIRLLGIGIFLFIFGICLNLVLNYLRFGSMLEFCYSANVNTPTGGYIQRFNFPYGYESFLNAARELAEAIFLNHRYEATQFYRLRQYSFPAFNLSHLFVLAAGMGSFIFLLLSDALNGKYPLIMSKPCFKAIRFSLAWGGLCFALLFMFYVHSPSITSRYLSEFTAAYYAILTSFILLGFLLVGACQDGIKKKALSLVFLFGVLVLFYFNNKEFFKHHTYKSYVTNKETIQKSVGLFNRQISANPSLPEIFYCRGSYGRLKIKYQFSGWAITGNCLVSDSTSVFLPTERCLTINYSVLGGADLLEVRAKRGLAFLKLEDSQFVENDLNIPTKKSIRQRFCSENFIPHTTALYTIGWIKANKIKVENEILPVKLNSVSTSR